MNAAFDVLKQPWIPVLDLEGTPQKLSLLDTLSQAHLLQKIQDPSPLVEYSVYRFLIVFLMDALRPEDSEALEELLEEESFDMNRIGEYITECRSEGVSFDLFGADRPFMQVPYNKVWDRDPKPISTLDYSVPNGNNHIHFNHGRKTPPYSFDKALRMLLTAQIFCTAQAQGYPSTANGAPPWFTLIQGENLFELLLFNMIGIDRIDRSLDEPPVFWRNTGIVESKKVVANTSWLYGMLFPARRIHLIPDEDAETVSSLYFSQGMNYLATDTWTDPHVTYRYTPKGRSNWKMSDSDAIWRNLNLLIDTKGQQAPLTMGQYVRELRPASDSVHLVLYGVQTSNASYLRLQRHDLQLPGWIMDHGPSIDFIKTYINLAERLGRVLVHSLSTLPAEYRTLAQGQFYDLCQQQLWSAFEMLKEPESNWDMTAQEEAMIRSATTCATNIIQQLTLRGKDLLETMRMQQSILGKEIAKIRKER